MEYVATAAFLLSVVAGSFAAVIFGGYGIAQLIASALYELGCKQHLSSLMSRRMVTERRQHAPAVVCPSRRGRCEDHFFRSVAQPQECLSLPEREPLPVPAEMQCERTSSSHVCGLLKRLRIAVGSGGCRRPAAIRRTNTPQILPVGSVRRKLSGSLPGCRSATYAARRIASATASASSWITDASFAMGIPFRSQSIPNTDALANFKRKVTPDVEWPLLKPFQTPAVASLCRHH
jgi:hypothetical protein